MWATWLLTVCWETIRESAISALDSPRAISVVRLGAEDHPEAGADQRLVVGEQNADHRSAAYGSLARTA
jgi:hypothetical protein